MYFSHATKNNSNLYGFVRFQTRQEALRVAGRMDGLFIQSCKISINLAKYGRNAIRNKLVKGLDQG